MQNTQKGFTLIEILVAITIVAVMASVGMMSFKGISGKGKDTKRKADLEQIRGALELYRSDVGKYPDDSPNNPFDLCGPGNNFSDSGNTYMKDIPCDPGGDPYTYDQIDDYNYTLSLPTTLSDGNPYSVSNP